MTMTVELRPEVAERLRLAAEKQGMEPETLAARTIEASVPEDPMQRVMWNGMTVEQWIRESREWADSHKLACAPG